MSLHVAARSFGLWWGWFASAGRNSEECFVLRWPHLDAQTLQWFQGLPPKSWNRGCPSCKICSEAEVLFLEKLGWICHVRDNTCILSQIEHSNAPNLSNLSWKKRCDPDADPYTCYKMLYTLWCNLYHLMSIYWKDCKCSKEKAIERPENGNTLRKFCLNFCLRTQAKRAWAALVEDMLPKIYSDLSCQGRLPSMRVPRAPSLHWSHEDLYESDICFNELYGLGSTKLLRELNNSHLLEGEQWIVATKMCCLIIWYWSCLQCFFGFVHFGLGLPISWILPTFLWGVKAFQVSHQHFYDTVRLASLTQAFFKSLEHLEHRRERPLERHKFLPLQKGIKHALESPCRTASDMMWIFQSKKTLRIGDVSWVKACIVLQAPRHRWRTTLWWRNLESFQRRVQNQRGTSHNDMMKCGDDTTLCINASASSAIFHPKTKFSATSRRTRRLTDTVVDAVNPVNAVVDNGWRDAIGTGYEKPFPCVFPWVCVDFRGVCGLNALVSVLQCTRCATRLISTNVFRDLSAFLCTCCFQRAKWKKGMRGTSWESSCPDWKPTECQIGQAEIYREKWQVGCWSIVFLWVQKPVPKALCCSDWDAGKN